MYTEVSDELQAYLNVERIITESIPTIIGYFNKDHASAMRYILKNAKADTTREYPSDTRASIFRFAWLHCLEEKGYTSTLIFDLIRMFAYTDVAYNSTLRNYSTEAADRIKQVLNELQSDVMHITTHYNSIGGDEVTFEDSLLQEAYNNLRECYSANATLNILHYCITGSLPGRDLDSVNKLKHVCIYSKVDDTGDNIKDAIVLYANSLPTSIQVTSQQLDRAYTYCRMQEDPTTDVISDLQLVSRQPDMPFDVLYAMDLGHYFGDVDTTEFVNKLVRCVLEFKNIPNGCTLLECAATFLPENFVFRERMSATVPPAAIAKPELTANKKVTLKGALNEDVYAVLHEGAIGFIMMYGAFTEISSANASYHNAFNHIPSNRHHLPRDLDYYLGYLTDLMGEFSDKTYALLGLALRRLDVLTYPDAHKKKVINNYTAVLSGGSVADVLYSIPDGYVKAIHFAFGEIPISLVVFISAVLLLHPDAVIKEVFNIE